jgi:hypothetical protein
LAGSDFGNHTQSYNATQARMERLLEDIANNHVEEPRTPSWSNPDGSRPSDLDREIEEHRRRQRRDADIQEYMRLAEAGVFVDPASGAALSQELRDRIAKNAKLQLADVLRARGHDFGAVRTMLGWGDSRDSLAAQIENDVRNNSWYRALDMLNPSVSGADPQAIARAMANVLNLSANQIEAWRAGQLPEGGNGGVTGFLYENFVAKQKVGLGTALRVDDLEKGGAIDQAIAAYRADVDAAVAALNEMAQTPDPRSLTPETHRLLQSLGFIATVDGKQTYQIPTGDPAQRLQRGLNLPGSTLLDLVSSANVIKIVVMVAAPELAAARIGAALEGLELGVGVVRAGEFITNVLANAALDAGFQKLERGTVQWDRVVLDAAVLNLGLGAVNQLTGAIAKATVGGLMTAEARALAEVVAKNRQAREQAESILRQTLGLYSDAALLTYWQSKFQPSGMTYDDFIANLLNGVVGRLAPSAARAAKEGLANATGLWAPRTMRDAIFSMSPELRDAFMRGLTPDQLARYIETARVAELESARREASERLSLALGDDYLKLDLTDGRFVDMVTKALESGQLSFTDLKSVLGDTPALTALMDGVNAHRLDTFNTIIETATIQARGEILAEYAARIQRFKDNLGEDSPMYKEALEVANAWRDAELKKLDDKIDVPGSTNRTSDVDRSITSAYLRNALKVAIDEVFMRRTGLEQVSTSARAYDVNEYFHIFKVIDRANASGMDLRTVRHTLPDGSTISHPDMMTAMALSVAMLDMPPAQRAQFKQNRLAASRDTAQTERLFALAEQSLAEAQRALDTEVARLAKEGYDPKNPDTVTRARDNMYGQRALDLAVMEATLARLDPKSEYARQLAAEIEAIWAGTMREGLEAYTNFPGLEIVVKITQLQGLTVREMIQGTVDPVALASANANRRKKGQPERTPAEQQRLIDEGLAQIAKTYTPEQLAGAIDDQVRFMIHHINGFFEGHESAIQAAAALSKYAERSVFLLQLSGADVTTGLAGELNVIAKELVSARSNLQQLTDVITRFGEGNANQGIRRLADLISQVVPGMRGLFSPTILTGLTSAGPAGAPTANAAGSASLNVLRRELELEREVIQRTAGSAMVVVLVQENKAALEEELALLQRQKAEDQRMAALYNRAHWEFARRLEGQVASLAIQLNALPFTNTPTAVQRVLGQQLNTAIAQLDALKKARMPDGVPLTIDDQLRDRRIASLQVQIKEEEAAVTHYRAEAERETAAATTTAGSGNQAFDPIRAAQRELMDTTRPSSTPALDAVGAKLAEIWDEPPPPYTPPMFRDDPPPPALAGGMNPIVTSGVREGGATVTIRPDGSLTVQIGNVTYPGMFGANGGFILWAPDTVIDLKTPPPSPIATTPPATIATDRMTENADGSVIYRGVPISGLPGPGGERTTSPLPGAVVFTPTAEELPTSITPADRTAPGTTKAPSTPGGGGGGGGGDSTIGSTGPSGSLIGDLGAQPGMGFGESGAFFPFPETTYVDVRTEDVSAFDPSTGNLNVPADTLVAVLRRSEISQLVDPSAGANTGGNDEAMRAALSAGIGRPIAAGEAALAAAHREFDALAGPPPIVSTPTGPTLFTNFGPVILGQQPAGPQLAFPDGAILNIRDFTATSPLAAASTVAGPLDFNDLVIGHPSGNVSLSGPDGTWTVSPDPNMPLVYTGFNGLQWRVATPQTTNTWNTAGAVPIVRREDRALFGSDTLLTSKFIRMDAGAQIINPNEVRNTPEFAQLTQYGQLFQKNPSAGIAFGPNLMMNNVIERASPPQATGSSPTYYDFGAIEEVQVTTGGADVSMTTGGVGINIVTRRGSNELHGSGRSFFTNDVLQSDNSETAGVGGSGFRTDQILEFGGEVGGPIVKDRLWFWGSANRNEIERTSGNLTGADNAALINYAGKLSGQITDGNEANVFYHFGDKVKEGRRSTSSSTTTTNTAGSGSAAESEVDLAGGAMAGDPGGCCTPGVQVMTLDFGEAATVQGSPQTPHEDAARRFSLPRMARSVAGALKSFVRGTPAATSTALSFANHSIGMPPALNAALARARETDATQAPSTLPITTILQANGNSQGEAFEMTIVNNGPNPLKVLGSGVVVEPIKRELQNQLRQQLAKIVPGPNVLKRNVEAYCLQYALAPPTPGMLFQIAGPALQERFKPAGMIMNAARQLGVAGALNPDSNPKSYLESIKQYAIWTKFENWDVKKFGEVLLDKTKQAATAAKANWTGQMQSALLAAVPNRWRDIQTVLSAAQELAARPPQ